MQPLEVAGQVRHPRQPEVGQGHGLGVLAEAVAGQDGVGVPPGQVEEHAAQAVDRFHHRQQLLALDDVDPDRAQVARRAGQVQAPADVLAQRADQVLLAGVEAAAHPRADLLHPGLLHLAQGTEDGGAGGRGQQALLHEHHGVGLVEGVQRVEHRAGAARREPGQLGEHLFPQADAGGAEATVLSRRLLEHGVLVTGVRDGRAGGTAGAGGAGVVGSNDSCEIS